MIEDYKRLNNKQLKEINELNEKIRNNKCVTIEDLENHFGKRIKGFNEGQSTSIIRVIR